MIELQLIAVLAATLAVLFLAVVLKNIASKGWLFLLYPPTFLVLFFTFLFVLPMVPVLMFSDSAIYRYSPEGYEPKSWLFALLFATLFILATVFVASRWCRSGISKAGYGAASPVWTARPRSGWT